MSKWNEFISKNKEIAIKELQDWIRIDSVYSESKEANKPFGEGVYNALRYIGALAEKEGFAVDYCDGYATEIVVGNGDKIISIYAHADVVPVGNGWKHEPFGAEIEDDIMYGRGTSDDKGPAMAAFYALKALKDEIVENGKYQVRLVIGGNEERGSACLEYYFNQLHKPYPDFGFTPDGDFPLIYGEKGICDYLSECNIDLSPIISIDAGIATNSVIDKAVSHIELDDILEEYLKNTDYKYKLEKCESEQVLTVYGKAAHGSTPELGVNAGLIMCHILGDCYGFPLLKLVHDSYIDYNGRNIDGFYETRLLHETTYNAGIITYKKDSFSMIVNFRYPEIVNANDAVAKIAKKIHLESRVLRNSEPLLMDPDSILVKTLYKAYVDETHDTHTPIMTIGGGTYAREAKNTVAFGSHFPDREDNIHDANEKIHLQDYLSSIGIYASAISELMKI